MSARGLIGHVGQFDAVADAVELGQHQAELDSDLDDGSVDGKIALRFAGVGILVSGLSAWLLMRHRGDINTRAAFLHMATDSLLSLGIVIAGVIISRTGLHVIDPAISLVVAAVILFNTLRLLLDALRTLFRK